jgi:hypothetical protein
MVFISVTPVSSQRIWAVFLALLGLSIVTCLADPFLLSVASTPYDRQMARIEPVLTSTPTSSKGDVSLQLVNRWIGDLRGIPYGFSMQWKTPAEVAHDPVADCKGKAVTLYERMRAHGARDVRLVIGKRAPSSHTTHAWVEWTVDSRTYVLDPTINWSACSASQLPRNCYVPYYAFSGGHKYRAAATGDLYARL